jgi:RNA polymerase sigma-70 factor (ECF subfamily)
MPPREAVGRAEHEPCDRLGESVSADFDRLFAAHYGSILAYAIRRVSNRETAEDVAAETFAVTWRRWTDVPADPLPWLYGVARRLIANDVRASGRRDRLHTRLGSNRSPSPRDPADLVQARDAVLVALDRLSEPEKEILRLVAWEGLDSYRGARALGCTRPAFALRLHRARRKLAKELEAAGHSPNEGERPSTTPAREET